MSDSDELLITVPTMDGDEVYVDRPRWLEGHEGVWLIHEAIWPRGHWSLTHVPTGLQMPPGARETLSEVKKWAANIDATYGLDRMAEMFRASTRLREAEQAALDARP